MHLKQCPNSRWRREEVRQFLLRTLPVLLCLSLSQRISYYCSMIDIFIAFSYWSSILVIYSLFLSYIDYVISIWQIAVVFIGRRIMIHVTVVILSRWFWLVLSVLLWWRRFLRNIKGFAIEIRIKSVLHS